MILAGSHEVYPLVCVCVSQSVTIIIKNSYNSFKVSVKTSQKRKYTSMPKSKRQHGLVPVNKQICECGIKQINCIKHGRISGFCECNKLKGNCKKHSKSTFCACGNEKRYCKTCPGGGSALCPCKKIKKICKIHGGKALCRCGKNKRTCKDCNGKDICPCGIGKIYCKKHGGSQICPCGISKQKCKIHGSNKHFCACNKQKSNCRIHGNRMCPCGKLKLYCAKHGGSNLCITCKVFSTRLKGSHCSGCSSVASRRSTVKEKRVAAFIDEDIQPSYTRWNKKNPDAKHCENFRPDFVWELKAEGSANQDEGKSANEMASTMDFCRVVVLEVDEHQHNYASYPKSCELSRMADIVQGYGGLPVHMVRYNPDSFKVNSFAAKVSYPEKTRLAALGNALKEAFDDADFASNLFTLQYLFYDNEENADTVQTLRFKDIEAYAAWMDEKLGDQVEGEDTVEKSDKEMEEEEVEKKAGEE